MERETLQTIHQLANERYQLYLRAGHQQLSLAEAARIDQITARLYTLWDQYRRELAAGSRESKERLAARARYETPEVRRTMQEEESHAA